MLSLDLRSRTTPITVLRTKYFLRYKQDIIIIIIFQRQLIFYFWEHVSRESVSKLINFP